MIPIRDTAPRYRKPYVTYGLIIACALVFIALELLPEGLRLRAFHVYGMVPARYAHGWAGGHGLPFDGYFSFVSNLFLHDGWLHLLMNGWFLWIFADNIEDRMGHGRFLAFYLLCGVIATYLQWRFDPSLTIPVVGASGAIAGVLGAYYRLYPFERVVMLLPPLLFNVPAIAFLGLWILWQLYNATTAVWFEHEAVNVAWWAHLGGFIAGCFLYPLFLSKRWPPS